MNSNTFDFNINNYSISDLEKYLNLDNEYDYDDDDINSKVDEFTHKIRNVSDTSLKKKLTKFIGEVKDILLNNNDNDNSLNQIDDLNPKTPTNNLISAGSTYVIDNIKSKKTSSNVQQVYPTEIAKGSITTLKRKTTTTTFCINSLFRETNSPSSTDCIYYLPYVLNNVTSMEVISMEIPQSIFLFSENNASNTIYFKEYSGADPYTPVEGLVILSPGNYKTGSSPDLITTLTTAINNQLGTGNRFTVLIDDPTNKITITNSTYIFEMYIVYPGTNKNISKTMGWTLGFRNPSYTNQLSYTTESIYNCTPANYLYLEINDFNAQQRATQVIGLFNNSYLDSNIIAKFDYTNNTSYTSYNAIEIHGNSILGRMREYYGPVHLQKMNIRLLDQYGTVVDLNGLDFSFTLQIKVLYEL
jgi:hypothetical protein